MQAGRHKDMLITILHLPIAVK